MKKVSTVVAKQRRDFSQPTLIIGLDLGERPTCTERTNRSSRVRISMATAATRRQKTFLSEEEHKIHLTPTGLLMEGD
jgi:hypothetical protein